ncbi:MAG: carboxylate--amine ligase [Candidatus Rokuibacteriota bacterium]|nr:MAG: carboxylate--amine ligase [Candidatus Rokubacteria bacterium]
MSSRVTFDAEPSRLFIEKSKCSLEAKWLVFDRQTFHSSLDAQPPTTSSDVPISSDRQCFPRIDKSSPEESGWHMLPSRGDRVNRLFVLDSPYNVEETDESMDALKIHSRPEGLRRPILIMAFGGWNDAAESATTAVRYLGTSFRAQKFAEIDPEEFYHFGLSRPYVRFKQGSDTEREIIWPATEFSITQASELARDVIVGVAVEPHLRWKTYCNLVLDLARRCEVALVLTLGALLAEVPHTRPVRLSGSASDPELAARLGVRPTKYEGPTGIVGVLNTICRDQGLATASLWANVPHYISGIENPKATLALVRRVAPILGTTIEVGDLEEAVKQFDANLKEIVAQNAKIANYVKKLESRDVEEPGPAAPGGPSDLPPAAELVAEFEQFLRQQRPE